MKIRTGFVSNSSSASFILDKRYISVKDLEEIQKYCASGECHDSWDITEDEDFVRGFTAMDNDYLYSWIKEHLNLPLKAVVAWGDR